MKRYSAKLLFQFRVLVNGAPGKVRLCEERIIVLRAPSARTALASAKRKGREAQHDYKNTDGHPVHYDFIGVMELLALGPECGAEEVWYDLLQRVQPSERKAKFIPKESQLNAIYWETKRPRQRKR